MNLKYLTVIAYVVLVAAFGFFYEDKNNQLKASSIDLTNQKNIDNYYDVDMPRYPGVSESPILGEQYINNARAQSSYFVTQDSPITLTNFYEKYWSAQGLKPFKAISPEKSTISVYDYKDRVTKTVTIEAERQNTYRVTLTALVDSKMKREFNAFSDIPHNEGSYNFISYESEDRNYRASSISYLNIKSFNNNESFYRSELTKKGWKFLNENTLPGTKFTKTLIFKKGSKIAEINLVDNNNSGTMVTLMVKDVSTGLIIKGAK